MTFEFSPQWRSSSVAKYQLLSDSSNLVGDDNDGGHGSPTSTQPLLSHTPPLSSSGFFATKHPSPNTPTKHPSPSTSICSLRLVLLLLITITLVIIIELNRQQSQMFEHRRTHFHAPQPLSSFGSVSSSSNTSMIRSRFAPKVCYYSTQIEAQNQVEVELPAVAVDITGPSNLSTKSQLSSPPPPLCPFCPLELFGPLSIQYMDPSWLNSSSSSLAAHFPGILPGGRHLMHPTCRSRSPPVAIIVPYRDRLQHLATFLHHLHPMLIRQQLNYRIVIVEQANITTANTDTDTDTTINDDEIVPFNRAKLFNVGFLEVLRRFPNEQYECFIFHDVDLLPEDDRNLYYCLVDAPRHLAIGIDKFSYKLLYQQHFGGVVAITRKQYETINGASNRYWGWGAEDDDLYYRMVRHGYAISRHLSEYCRYTMIWHKPSVPNPNRIKLLKSSISNYASYHSDGLSNTNYRVLSFVDTFPLYTWITVDIGEPSSSTDSALSNSNYNF